MRFFELLWTEAVNAQSLWLLGVVVMALAVRTGARERRRAHALILFFTLHVLLLVVTAIMGAVGSPFDGEARIPMWVFGAVCFVDAGAHVLFTGLLPRLAITVPRIVQDVIIALLSLVLAVTVASRAGVNLSGIIATSAVATAVLGFSLQDVISNVAGGLALQLDTSLEVGDWVKVGDVSGRVAIRWRYTALETRNWETVLVPNSVLMKSQVTVLGRRKGAPKLLRRWVYFSVDWRHQPSDVVEAVQNAVRGAKLERVATEPQPSCVLMDMTESMGKYAVRYWLTDFAVDDPTDSEVRTCVYFALRRAGITPAIPATAVFVTQETTDRVLTKEQKELARRKGVLERCELFAALSEPEREQLARRLKYAPFTRGDVLTRQGAEAHWLYLIEDGTASIHVAEAGVDKVVARLGSGSFFGEMGLLTGEPRSATVIAEGDVECFRLDKQDLKRVLEQRPNLAEDLAAILSKRRAELDAVKKGLDAETTAKQRAGDARHLVDRIRSFFKLD